MSWGRSPSPSKAAGPHSVAEDVEQLRSMTPRVAQSRQNATVWSRECTGTVARGAVAGADSCPPHTLQGSSVFSTTGSPKACWELHGATMPRSSRRSMARLRTSGSRVVRSSTFARRGCDSHIGVVG